MLETFNHIDQLLREMVTSTKLTFTTIRSRFLYVATEYKLSERTIKYGSIVFNLHVRIAKHGYICSDIENDLTCFLYQELYNLTSTEKKNQFSSDDILRFETLLHAPDKKENAEELTVYLGHVSISETKYKLPRYELSAINSDGETIVINLWLDISPEQTIFSKRYDLIVDLFSVNKAIRFFNLSWSDKGFYYQNSETYFVYEPDFLIDISSIAECFSGQEILPQLYFLPYIKSMTYSLSLFKGSFVNYLLDAIISGREIDIDNEFEKELEKQILKTFKYTSREQATVLSDIKINHLQNLYDVVETYSDDTITLEPYFISSLYGIQGRLDALIEKTGESNLKSVFELKSGKPHPSSWWQNNYAQVIGYNLILRSVYGSDWSGHTAILYSMAEENPLRNVTYSSIVAKNFLMCRNIIVAQILALAENRKEIIEFLYELQQKKLPSYHKTDLDEFLVKFKQLQSYEREYYHLFVNSTFREMMAKKVGYIDSAGYVRPGFSSLWNADFSQKVEQQQILHISYECNNLHDNTFEFSINSTQNQLTNLRSGDILLLYPAMNGEPRPLSVPVFKAVLVSIDDKNIVIRFRNEFIDSKQIEIYHDFFLETDLMDSTMIGTIANLKNIVTIDQKKRDILLGISEPGIIESEDVEFSGNTYDRIMQKARCLSDYLLIQGPPGTGKTSRYLIDIVKQQLSQYQQPIVICAYTHRAVDEICQQLSEHEIEFILLTNDPKKRDNLKLSEWLRNSEVSSDSPAECLVFVSTILHLQSVSSFLGDIITLDLLIVDEASQILEANLIGLVSQFKKFILIGDHYQLPAISISEPSDISPLIVKTIGLHSHRESLFERLYRRCVDRDWNQAIDLLDEHYRMHSDIANLVNPFYIDKLNAVADRQFQPLSLYKKSKISNQSYLSLENIDILTSKRLIFFDTKEKSSVRHNREEADRVLQLTQSIFEMIGEGFSENTLGIICTWRLQINLITSLLSHLPYFDKITIDTVERYQGTERDVVIYSTAISNENDLARICSSTWDGQVDRKLNVAISRAREQFILLGHSELLSLSPHYRRVIESICSI
jgi:hypothetical protein